MTPATITKTDTSFSMSCGVEINIQASASRIWGLLTDAQGFPRWNAMITRIEGEIREGQRLRLHVPGTDRTFTPTVSALIPGAQMTWAGGLAFVFKGVRTFKLTSKGDGSIGFAMTEHFSGLLLPLAKNSMPDFGPVFERFAEDLRREAERMP